jgi:gamma-glutamylcysteine synthetase
MKERTIYRASVCKNIGRKHQYIFGLHFELPHFEDLTKEN